MLTCLKESTQFGNGQKAFKIKMAHEQIDPLSKRPK